jgi:hypothetical protein
MEIKVIIVIFYVINFLALFAQAKSVREKYESEKKIVASFEDYLKSVYTSDDELNETILFEFLNLLARIGRHGISKKKIFRAMTGYSMMRYG